jgi:L-asparagine transporter-like permease
MAKLYDIKLTSANAPDALFTVYYNSVNSATIAVWYLIIILQLMVTRAQLITGTGLELLFLTTQQAFLFIALVVILYLLQ